MSQLIVTHLETILFAFVVIYMVLRRSLNGLKGWQQLATNYGFRRPPIGRARGVAKVLLDEQSNPTMCHYRISPRGLYLKPVLPLLGSRYAVLLPWNQLKTTSYRQHFRFRGYDCALTLCPDLSLALSDPIVLAARSFIQLSEEGLPS